MNTLQIAAELKSGLEEYRAAVSGTVQSEDMADYQRLIAVTQQVIDQLDRNDLEGIKLTAFAFSRCVTDSFAVQPPAYRRLSGIIGKLKEL